MPRLGLEKRGQLPKRQLCRTNAKTFKARNAALVSGLMSPFWNCLAPKHHHLRREQTCKGASKSYPPIQPVLMLQMNAQTLLRARMATRTVARRGFSTTRPQRDLFSPHHYPEGPRSNLPFNPKTRFFWLRYWTFMGRSIPPKLKKNTN